MDDFDWLMPDDYEVAIPPDASEPPLVRLALDTLVDSEDAVLRDWIKIVFPKLLDFFSIRNAKGMSRFAAEALTAELDIKLNKREKIIGKLVNLKDQSLAIHLLNAALGGWSSVKLASLDKLKQRLYLAGITLHDLNKIVLPHLGTVRMDGKEWDRYRTVFEAWGEALKLWEFISKDYWQDVAYLAQNAEARRGANLTQANFPDTQLTPRLLDELSDFVRFGDLVASIAYHPNDLDDAREVVRLTLGKKYVTRYHRTNENRGLITQEIHNAVLVQARNVGWKPFLFFPDGVTYFAPKNVTEPNISNVPETVRNSILERVSKGLDSLVSRAGKGIKYSPDLAEIAEVNLATKTIIRRTFAIISEKKTPVTDTRREKILAKVPELADLDWEYPANHQTDRFAEGINAITGIVGDYYGLGKEAIAQSLLEAFGLSQYYEDWKRIPPDGGVPHGWYYVAGHYMKQNSSLSSAELEEQMIQTVQNVLAKLGKPDRPPPFAFLETYISQVLDLNQSNQNHDFAGELSRYHRNKAKRKREAVCAICNSAFEIREEFSNYSNKRVTSPSKESKRGICTVCQVEKLLRRYGMGADLAANDETIYLHLYPAYYFTPETTLLMSSAYKNFAQSVFSELDKEFSEQEYNPDYVAHMDIFRTGINPNQNEKRRTNKVEYTSAQMNGYYLLGMPYLGKDPSDTEAWQMPALQALLAPLVFGVKVVASRNAVPPYDSGADFKETVIVDGVHSYWQHSIGKVHFRLDELRTAIPAAFSIYSLTSQAYRDSRNYPVWNALNVVSRSLDTSPLYVFHYADRIKENFNLDEMPVWLADKLINYYTILMNYYKGQNPMEMIKELVDKYACFYEARGKAAYARLRPFNTAAKVVLKSSPETSKEDLQLMIEGQLMTLLDDIRDQKTEGFLPNGVFKNRDKSETMIQDFAQTFLNLVFYDYCRNERSLLRQNINLLRKGAEAYYVKTYVKKQNKPNTEEE